MIFLVLVIKQSFTPFWPDFAMKHLNEVLRAMLRTHQANIPVKLDNNILTQHFSLQQHCRLYQQGQATLHVIDNL